MHILTADFDLKYINKILDLTSKIQKSPWSYTNILPQKTMATLFYEPSTRTRLSSEIAMLKLGGNVASTPLAELISSNKKGESLKDTVKTVSRYADVLVIRHPDVNSIQEASKYSRCPIISAGDGYNEHPTQALLDLYTIKQKLGRLDNFTILFAGDLVYSRTIRSLCKLLKNFDNIKALEASKTNLNIGDQINEFSIPEYLPEIDVLYMTRLQTERHGCLSSKIERRFTLTNELSNTMKKEAIILHPLPKLSEIREEVDDNPRAKYFDQAENGLYVRMAILTNMLY